MSDIYFVGNFGPMPLMRTLKAQAYNDVKIQMSGHANECVAKDCPHSCSELRESMVLNGSLTFRVFKPLAHAALLV